MRFWSRWPNTLLARLLLAQAFSALALVLVFAGLFYVERNRTVGRLVAERWAPVLRQAQAAATPGAAAWPKEVLLSTQAPATTVMNAWGGPRVLALRDTLRANGLPVQQVALWLAAGERPLVWVALPGPLGRTRWLGFSDELVEPHLPARALLALGLGCAIVAGVSWGLARRLAHPLEELRQRIEQHQPESPEWHGAAGARAPTPQPSSPPSSPPNSPPAPLGAGPSAHGPIAGATREVAAIANAWQALQERLAQHERERALLLAGVSHDLRSPLARIRMAAELLPEADPTLARRREAIVRNTEVADRLIASFLDHVRSSSLPLNETVDLAELARQLVQDRLAATASSSAGAELALASAAQAPLSLNAPALLLLPQANRLLMERVLSNLLDNAFQHGRPPVALRLRHAPAHSTPNWPSDWPSNWPGGALCIEVQDAGTGIPPAQAPQLLQAFARGDASRHTPGTGLGLAVVAQVVQRLGGTLAFEQLPSGGVVRLLLPLRG
jgi:two-component system osmolarity sensor histidine kinase EnvZ